MDKSEGFPRAVFAMVTKQIKMTHKTYKTILCDVVHVQTINISKGNIGKPNTWKLKKWTGPKALPNVDLQCSQNTLKIHTCIKHNTFEMAYAPNILIASRKTKKNRTHANHQNEQVRRPSQRQICIFAKHNENPHGYINNNTFETSCAPKI